MSENYRPEEKSRYSEIYRPNEYNRSEERSCAVENFVSEEFRTRTESAKPSNGNKAKSDKLKKSLLGSGIITAAWTVAGAAVIVAAVVLTAVLEITVKSFTVTSGSLFIKLGIENTANTVLTAVLSSEEEVYSRTIEKGVGTSELYFYLLEPDTEYLLEVKGETDRSVIPAVTAPENTFRNYLPKKRKSRAGCCFYALPKAISGRTISKFISTER